MPTTRTSPEPGRARHGASVSRALRRLRDRCSVEHGQPVPSPARNARWRCPRAGCGASQRLRVGLSAAGIPACPGPEPVGDGRGPVRRYRSARRFRAEHARRWHDVSEGRNERESKRELPVLANRGPPQGGVSRSTARRRPSTWPFRRARRPPLREEGRTDRRQATRRPSDNPPTALAVAQQHVRRREHEREKRRPGHPRRGSGRSRSGGRRARPCRRRRRSPRPRSS